MNVSPRAGQPTDPSILVNVPKLATTYYYMEAPDPSVPKQETENIYKIYAEDFRGAGHLCRILEEAQAIVGDALEASPQQPRMPSEPTLKENL